MYMDDYYVENDQLENVPVGLKWTNLEYNDWNRDLSYCRLGFVIGLATLGSGLD